MNLRKAIPAVLITSTLLMSGCNSQSGADEKKPAAQANEQTTTSTAPAAEKADFKDAIEQYRKYVIEECDSFVTLTGEFVAAVKSGDMEKAKSLYAPARMHYERIEPIAEALGDLDPNIDARDGDVEAKDWRGFHRIEQALWEKKTTDGQQEYADRLLSDAKLLRAKVETVEIEASLLVTGAVELLNEVSTSKVTGEEERYSHTDLYDFAANVEGAQKIYELLKPQLEKKDAELDKQIETKFKALTDELAPFKKEEGYVSYTELTKEDVRRLSQNLDALAEPLSHMGKLLGV
ncbi:EfeM/EfeO family lipoprotein [Paenibacillus sp. ACRRX]|uniref:iron uptake system protein EfeO n=1 Tax=unclassified Paenibacillus TaxID=185978 RepID=UPI001EF5DD0A|nr:MULTISPECIES: iron uptake system protein EfeO [unclassified Paenibacillus]MCG7406907.1 EfeM/EfeO family lipoprotein [Paenibacillus sp. ACRRX]MDK8179840.1 imelysin family protein [Paenibacillus sp. UMB4589-SE434]